MPVFNTIHYAKYAAWYTSAVGTPHSCLSFWSVKDIADLCGVDLSTARRWKRGAICLPESARKLLEGDLGCMAPEWRGWIIRGGELLSPEGWSITVNDVLASPLLRTQLAVYQAENRELRAVQESMEEQPLPGELPAIIVA